MNIPPFHRHLATSVTITGRALLLCLVLNGVAVSSRAQQAVPEPPPETPQHTTEAMQPTPQEPDEGEVAGDAVDALPPAPDAAPAAKAAEQPAPVKASSQPAAVAVPPRMPTLPPVEWRILDEPAKMPAPRAPVPVVVPADGEAGTSSEKPPISTESLRSIVTRRNLALPLAAARIEIDKSERRLDLYSGSTLVKSYGVALGNNPSGHKQRQGDGRTPEGRFYICTRNAKDSAFHIFLGLSYPGLPDAKRAVSSNQITWREYQVINQRLASRGTPLWETNLGGWVGIHGGTDAAFARKKISQRGSQDWTAGCVALTNREIAELHAATQMGTPVDIKP